MNKILIFSNYYYPNVIGGAEISTQILAESLYKENFQPVIVTLGAKDTIRFVNNIKVYEVSNYNIYALNEIQNKNSLIRAFWHFIDIRNLFIRKKIEKIIINEKPDIIHTNNIQGFSSIVWLIAKEYNLPVVHTLRDYYLMCPNVQLYSKKNINPNNKICKLFSLKKKDVSNNVDYVVGISKYILNFHLQLGYFGNSKKKVIYNSINQLGIRKIMNKQPIFGYVGRLEKAKGIEFMLELFAKELNTIPLFLYGASTDEIYLKYLKDRFSSNNINFMGKEKIENIMKTIDVTIVPSIWNEPFGRVVIESFAHGVPVIASNRGGLPELVNHGKNGFIFNVDKFKELLKYINTLVDDNYLLKQMAANAYESAKQFTNEKNLEKYLEIYSELVK